MLRSDTARHHHSEQSNASSGEMSDRLAEQALEISSLRAQLAAAPQALDDSLEDGMMGGMSLGESLGDAFGEMSSISPPPPPVVGGGSSSSEPALTAEMREKLGRVEALEAENEDLRQQVSALQVEAEAGAEDSVKAQQMADELRDLKGRYEDGQEKVQQHMRDVKRMKGFLKEAKDVIEKQQLKIKEAERKGAGERSAMNSQQVAQLKADVARLREARDQAEVQRRELVDRTNMELRMMTTAFYAQRERYSVELQSLKVSKKPSWLMGYQRQTLREGRSAAAGVDAARGLRGGGGGGGGGGAPQTYSPPPTHGSGRQPPPPPRQKEQQPPPPPAIE